MFSKSNKTKCQLCGLRHWQIARRYQKIVYDKCFLHFNPFCLLNFINHSTLIFRIFTIVNSSCSQHKIPTSSSAIIFCGCFPSKVASYPFTGLFPIPYFEIPDLSKTLHSLIAPFSPNLSVPSWSHFLSSLI